MPACCVCCGRGSRSARRGPPQRKRKLSYESEIDDLVGAGGRDSLQTDEDGGFSSPTVEEKDATTTREQVKDYKQDKDINQDHKGQSVSSGSERTGTAAGAGGGKGDPSHAGGDASGGEAAASIASTQELLSSPSASKENKGSSSREPKEKGRDKREISLAEATTVQEIAELLACLRIPEAHFRAKEFLADKEVSRNAKRQVRQLPQLGACGYGLRKLREGIQLIFDEDDAADHVSFQYEYDDTVFDVRINIFPDGFMKIFVDIGIFPVDLFHAAAFVAEIDLLHTWVPFLRESEICQEFAGYADLLWRSKCKLPVLPLHSGFECFHQRLCFDMLSSSKGNASLALPHGVKALMITECSPDDSNWRGFTIPDPPRRGPTRVFARMLGFMAYPVEIHETPAPSPSAAASSSSKPGTTGEKEHNNKPKIQKGFVVKAATEADFQLPRWMIPNSALRTVARLLCRNFLSNFVAQSKKWDEAGVYPKRQELRPELYAAVEKRIQEFTEVVTVGEGGDFPSIVEAGRHFVLKNRELSRSRIGQQVAHRGTPTIGSTSSVTSNATRSPEERVVQNGSPPLDEPPPQLLTADSDPNAVASIAENAAEAGGGSTSCAAAIGRESSLGDSSKNQTASLNTKCWGEIPSEWEDSEMVCAANLHFV
ncbi:unnamed protein product [Amoebophrya sp. A25]|nr:unnamed protein product [Amoebophrya sp. A25]|eukprot:GSA25T00006715001.1